MSSEFITLLTEQTDVYDLGRPMFIGMPQLPDHPPFRMTLGRRHGDLVRGDGSSGANELIITGGHVGTHIDALSHISFDGLLHGGIDARAAEAGGAFTELGAETIGTWVCRGVLLDVARAAGRDRLDAGQEVTADLLDHALSSAGVELRDRDVILIHTGWGSLFADRDTFVSEGRGTPGPGQEGADWLAAKNPRAVGSDTIAFERIVPEGLHAGLPAHRTLIVDHGIHIIELLNLSQLAAASVSEFVFVLAPLSIVGATGAPVRPLAVVDRPSTS